MDIKQLIFDLCSAHGVSGSEESAVAVAEKYLSDIAEVTTDHNGNLYAVTGDKTADKTILLDAHIDRIGLIVTDINDNGFVKVDKCGGIDARVLQDTVLATENGLRGTVCCLPPHLTNGSEDKAEPISKTWVDFGLPYDEVKEDIRKRVQRDERTKEVKDSFIAKTNYCYSRLTFCKTNFNFNF